MFLATFSGRTVTKSEVARIPEADKNGARIAGLRPGFDFPMALSAKSGPN